MACSGCLSVRGITPPALSVVCFAAPGISISGITLSNGLPLCRSEPELMVREATMPRLMIRNFRCVPINPLSFQDYRVGHVHVGGENAITGGDVE